MIILMCIVIMVILVEILVDIFVVGEIIDIKVDLWCLGNGLCVDMFFSMLVLIFGFFI